MKMTLLAGVFMGLLCCGATVVNIDPPKKTAYRVENIKMPEGLTSENGAVEFLPDGRMVACFTRG